MHVNNILIQEERIFQMAQGETEKSVSVSICLPPGVLVTSEALRCNNHFLCVFSCSARVALNLHPDRAAGCQADDLLPQGFANTVNTDPLGAWPPSTCSSLKTTHHIPK